ncbi:hypothetical protein [Pseudomonas citronellolis]|uniref:hypothetical protein n=1 Tax=Pseudomonas citronellolis TaxID=53408 RepID=UPI0021BE3F01|nr:hypothetical protein [Pseudomonas citronellolis]UXJ50302.1 hypothetical protein N5P21_20165 [Pseudomonas citronellolis]
MTSYSSRLDHHLKNQARKLRRAGGLPHNQALNSAAIDFGFSGWEQAHAHMKWADARIREYESSLPDEIHKQAAKLRAVEGYPFSIEDRIGIRYLPSDNQHVEGVARRLVYLRLFEEIHAPANLNRMENARLWFRTPLPLEDTEGFISTGRMRLQWLASNLGQPNSPTPLPFEYGPVTPELVRTRLLEYIHALHSVSVIRNLSGTLEKVIRHPCFKAFTSCALAALLSDQKHRESLSTILNYAGIANWVQSGTGKIDLDQLYWIERDELPQPTPYEGVSMLVGSPLHPRLRKPLNSLLQDQHQRLADTILLLERFSPEKTAVQKKLEEIRSTLADWMGIECGNQDRADKIYFGKSRNYGTTAFLAPAEERYVRGAFRDIRRVIETGYEACLPRAHLLDKLGNIELSFEQWLDHTRDHWKKTNQKLLMDSIGLVAVNPKYEVLLEAEADWKQTDFMGTSREANLIASIRPHLFKYWKEEDEANGYAFDDASTDSEQSILDHLNDLTFYRYIGEATTSANFIKDIRKAFYFDVEHAWFKQRLIQ